jgi:hypothetical protein
MLNINTTESAMQITWTADLRNDLISYGTGGEEPGDVIGEVQYVVVTDETGRRYAHDRTFDTTKRTVTDDGFVTASRNPQGKAAADRFLAKVIAAIAAGTWAGPVNNPHWTAIQPVYGSDAYAKDQARWEFGAMDDDERAAYLRRHGGEYPVGA